MWRRVPRSEGPGQVSPDDFRSDTTVLAPRSVAVCRLPAAERKAQDGRMALGDQNRQAGRGFPGHSREHRRYGLQSRPDRHPNDSGECFGTVPAFRQSWIDHEEPVVRVVATTRKSAEAVGAKQSNNWGQENHVSSAVHETCVPIWTCPSDIHTGPRHIVMPLNQRPDIRTCSTSCQTVNT